MARSSVHRRFRRAGRPRGRAVRVFYDVPRQASLLTRTEVTRLQSSAARRSTSFLDGHRRLSGGAGAPAVAALGAEGALPVCSTWTTRTEKERLISSFQPRYYVEGETIIAQGEEADLLLYPPAGRLRPCPPSARRRTSPCPSPSIHRRAVVWRGGSACMPPSAPPPCSCQSPGGCRVWSVNGREFLAHCQRASLFLQHVFYRFAQRLDDVTQEKLMTREDFLAAMRFINRHSSHPSSSSSSSSSSLSLSDTRLRLMFRLADVSGDSAISFVEFLHLHIPPHPPALVRRARLPHVRQELLGTDRARRVRPRRAMAGRGPGREGGAGAQPVHR